MFEMYNSNQTNENLKVKYEYFRNVFVNNYNISIKTLSSDKRSKCKVLKEGIKNTHFENKQKLQTALAVHQKSANSFYPLLKNKTRDK